MLQQTQVKTVIPYWERWMAVFPDVQTLAAAPEADVLKLWEGLGYYSRARNLLKAARQICERRDGRFPHAYEEILELPGVGRYTAGAICSIAFGLPTAILDGNVARVISRLFQIGGDSKSALIQKRLWELSHSLVQAAADCSALNQGLMELGATICLPRSPLCAACPVRRDCRAFAANRVECYPGKGKTVVMRERRFAALLLERSGHVLVRQRSRDVVNGGLWEFPNFELGPLERAEERLAPYGALQLVETIKHTITRNRITLSAYAGKGHGSKDQLSREMAASWVCIDDLQKLAFSSAHARLRALIQGRHGPGNKGRVA